MDPPAGLYDRFLDRVVALTAIRDLEGLERAVLATLDEFLAPEEVYLFKVDRADQLRQELRMQNGQQESASGEDPLPRDLLEAVRLIRLRHLAYEFRPEPDRFATIRSVLQTPWLEVFIRIRTVTPPTESQARLTGSLLEVFRNQWSLIDDSQRDKLTGLANRKTFEDSIGRVVARSGGAGESYDGDRRSLVPEDGAGFWLGMIDVDHFKRVNDTFGHLYGDEVLLLVAQIMQACFRDDDYLFRFGGEEFVAVVRCANAAGARIAFERFRETIASHAFPQVGQVTLSVGAVRIRPDEVVTSLLDRADQALYYAKEHGRNRVCFFEELLAEGHIRAGIKTGSVDYF